LHNATLARRLDLGANHGALLRCTTGRIEHAATRRTLIAMLLVEQVLS
jgi:hypothetical protein